MTVVGVFGDGPATEAVRAALEDTDASVRPLDDPSEGTFDADSESDLDVVVVVGHVSESFDAFVDGIREAGTPLVVVELGGVGGTPVSGVEAAISGWTPDTACYDCLCGRVAAGEPATEDGACDESTARFAGAVAGRELARLVDGDESTLLGSVVEVPHVERRVLPLPYCDCSSGDSTGSSLRRDHDPRSLDEALSRAEVALDDRLGPVAEVGEVESFPVPYYLATLADAPFSDGDVPSHAAGVGANWDPAFMRALGEALERYSAAVYRASDFDATPANPIPPGRFVQPGGADETDAVDAWVDAEHLDTGETVQLPAETVVFPPPERRIRPAITTGLGLGNDGLEALRSGLYEVIERDAAMLSWYSTYDPLGLDVADDTYGTIANRARSEGLESTALLLTQDVDVPVVAACVHRDGDWPRFAAGSAADLDPAAAAVAALTEALQNWLELRRMGPDRAAEATGEIGHYASFPEAARTFVESETTVPATSVGPDDPVDGRAEFEALVERVGSAGLDPYGARVTPRDVANLGFEAVRVVVPAAQPLFTGDPYFGDRARTVPEQLGFEPRLDGDPHPFP